MLWNRSQGCASAEEMSDGLPFCDPSLDLIVSLLDAGLQRRTEWRWAESFTSVYFQMTANRKLTVLIRQNQVGKISRPSKKNLPSPKKIPAPESGRRSPLREALP